jgi:hypothetical protein
VSGQIPQTGQGVIEGLVKRFNSEDPIGDVNVIATGGPSTSVSATVGQLRSRTDNGGRFAFRNLPPGRYSVSAERDGYFRRFPPGGSDPAQLVIGPEQSTSRVVLSLVPGGTISGRILDPAGRPAAAATLTAARLHYVEGRPAFDPVKSTMSDDRGDYRLYWLEPGEYFVLAEKNLPAGPARSYFPGGDDGRAAIKVVVNEGAESARTDFSLAASPAGVNVSGVVTIAVAGLENSASIQTSIVQQFYLVPMDAGRGFENPISFLNALTSAEDRAAGRFELGNVRPGRYELYSILQDRSAALTRHYVGHLSIAVGTQDVGGIALRIAPGVDLKGTIRYGNGVAVPSAPVRVQLRPRASFPAVSVLSALSATVAMDGTFTIPNVPEGQYTFSVGPLPANTYIGEFLQGRNSIVDDGIVIVDRRLSDTLEVHIQTPPAAIRGAVSATPQQLAAGVTITLVPDDARRDNFSLYKRTVATATGTFSFSGVPPGRYKLFAWERIPDGAEQSREFMEALFEGGTEIAVAAGDTSTAGLRLTSK